ncbi:MULTISPECIES: MucB/RseB C-terminal domain-containing protein [unclassified Pseudoalteromonas]|jgi:sigma-E factor negative regulatory protein RseB|uniref:MucB/RseB C-terminal domain-containing protein n=1 Tax=unclassified Pseudoalteromonas TaxID=194690 RepID=UPI0002315F7A|nr:MULTISPECIES: MucB/RseB C-terminal domain-containing protein [unclassified Pseudoalteromonas]MBL1384846.1 MucB/RseB C-terminal domain-containing protein [Colwellia sp.]TMS80719.1 anti-sigma E factor [Pseudoalteromonas sp. S554]UOB74321.1 MucB/RseB C-terminal domain-containing protein [Pseudoalteromonas sp. APM04]BBW92286.1 sigma-E factor regulatory protein RseB [Pseudoalteromonas sp. PS1M3]GAA77216.1 sigma-E factor negative regulatory protein RseB [Pseudoalteromonas sp. BSi20480]|tara:strand:+ start:5263 stop:6213 length:951 start_codon:yes stop_codon:yes gene_type:complete
MKVITFVLSLVLSFTAVANDTNPAKTLLLEMANAVHNRNFDASFVVVKGKSMEPYRWVHAKQGETELEHLSLLNGAGLEMIRVNDQVTYFEPQSEPYSLKTDSIAGPIPEVLFKDIQRLSEHYDFVLGGKGRIAGRAAQLVRIESKDEHKYNYWIWLDMESALLLKAAYVNHQGEALEQLQLTHISVTEQPAPMLLEVLNRNFPTPLPESELEGVDNSSTNWKISWLPAGFELLKSDRHKLDLNNELTDYYLYSDGFVEVSVFIQRPLPGKRLSGALTSGATTVYVHNGGNFDVSVVGNVPSLTAKAIAESVTRAL